MPADPTPSRAPDARAGARCTDCGCSLTLHDAGWCYGRDCRRRSLTQCDHRPAPPPAASPPHEMEPPAPAPRAEGEDAARLAEIAARSKAATPGPWAYAQTAEKGYGANVGSGCFAEDDVTCSRPLSGDLTHREDDYHVDEGVAEMSSRDAFANARFIAHAREDVPWLAAEVRRLRSALAEAQRDGERWKRLAARWLLIARQRGHGVPDDIARWADAFGPWFGDNLAGFRAAIDAARSPREDATTSTTEPLRLYGADAEAVEREQANPAADTPERRATFARVNALTERLRATTSTTEGTSDE
jgi:hypothetical protein